MCAHSFCFCLNQLCCSTEIKADGSSPYKESIQSVHINRQCKMSPPVLAEADPGSGSDGNKTINRVWLGPEQSESSTADMRTHSRHVSREPQTPGTPDPTSICKSVRPPRPSPQNKPHTRTATPVRGLIIAAYNCHSGRAEFSLHAADDVSVTAWPLEEKCPGS